VKPHVDERSSPQRTFTKVFEDDDGEDSEVALRLRRLRHIGSSCHALELPPPSHARLLARSGAAAFGRAGAFGARWHLHWHATLSSRAVQSRASARSQALDAACVSRKNHVVRGDASKCAERKKYN
jgi:hypothetical protein